MNRRHVTRRTVRGTGSSRVVVDYWPSDRETPFLVNTLLVGFDDMIGKAGPVFLTTVGARRLHAALGELLAAQPAKPRRRRR